MKRLDSNIAKKYSQMYDEGKKLSKVPAIPYDKNLKCIELTRTFCRGEYNVDLFEKTLGELVNIFYVSNEIGGEFAEYGNPFIEFSENFPTKNEFIQHITNGHLVKGIATEEQEFLIARKDQELQMYEELERLESQEEKKPDPEFEIIKNKRTYNIKSDPIFKKGSEEAGMEIDIEEGVKKDYKKFNIELPRAGEMIDVDVKEFRKIFKNTHKDKIDFKLVDCDIIVKDIDIKNEMLYVILGKHVINENTLSFLKDEQITYTYKPKIGTVFYSRKHKGPISVVGYFATGFKGGGIEYWILVPDKSQPHLPLVTAVPFSVGVDNWAEYKNWLETQKILKKGSEEAGMEIDIEENKKFNDWYNYNTVEVTNKIKQKFGVCTDTFWKWLFEENFADFDSDLSFKDNILGIWENMVENGIDSGMSKRDSIEQAQNYLNEYIEMFEASKAYKNCLEIKAVLKKGSEEAGMEIDIEENAKDFMPIGAGDTFYFTKKYIGIENKNEIFDFIRFLDTYIKPKQRKTNADTVDSMYLQMTWDAVEKIPSINLKDYYSVQDEKLALCRKRIIQQLWEKYELWQKAQEVLKKGSEKTGVEIDIEESIDYEWETLIKSYPDSNIFIVWLYKHLIEEGSIDEDNDLEHGINPGFESIHTWYMSRIENASYDDEDNEEDVVKNEINKLYNSREYKYYKKIYKKRQDILKKGSEEAGMDIDI
jgi:hypothetical protein